MPNYQNKDAIEKVITLSVDIPEDLKDKLKFVSYKDKKSIKDIVRGALEEYLNNKS